jgi:hypothetical protein
MAIQPTREEAQDTGTLEAYAHLYDVKNALRKMETAYEQLREYIDEKNYTFTDTFIVNLTGGVTSTVIAYDDIAHRYVAGKEKYEVYKANFTFNVPQAYTAGTSLELSFKFSYNGSNVTATRQTMATVINKDTGAVVGNYVTKYTTGTNAKYTLTVPVTETIPAKTNLVVLMNYI